MLLKLNKNLMVGVVYIFDNEEYCDWLKVSEIDIKNIENKNLTIKKIIKNGIQ